MDVLYALQVGNYLYKYGAECGGLIIIRGFVSIAASIRSTMNTLRVTPCLGRDSRDNLNLPMTVIFFIFTHQ